MKKIEIYLKDELVLSMLVESYIIDTYVNSFEINCKVEEVQITYSMPLNKGYRIVADV